MAHQGYGFCEFLTEEDAEYACKIMNQIKLWGKPIRVNKVRSRLSFPHAFERLMVFVSLCWLQYMRCFLCFCSRYTGSDPVLF